MDGADLSDLDVFMAVARSRSFRGAAKLRGQSASALSEALRRLEQRLGVRLLNRTTRSVTPTDAGRQLLERLEPALNSVGSALESLNDFRATVSGPLRLNVPTIVAEHVLPALLGAFLAQYPGIRAEVTAEDNFIDVLAAGYDAGVRYDERVERDMIAIPIGPRTQRFVTAASPGYFARRRRPQHPNDLLDHDCLRFRFQSGVMPGWEFVNGSNVIKISPPARLIANRLRMIVDAAQRGLGIVHGFAEVIQPSVADGTLELVLEDWSERFPGAFLYYANRRHMPGPLRAFVDFLKAAANQP